MSLGSFYDNAVLAPKCLSEIILAPFEFLSIIVVGEKHNRPIVRFVVRTKILSRPCNVGKINSCN